MCWHPTPWSIWGCSLELCSVQQIAAVCHRFQALHEIFHSLHMLYNFSNAAIWDTLFISLMKYLKLSSQVTCPKIHSWKQQWSLNLAPFCAKAGCCLLTCIDTELYSLCAKQHSWDYKGNSISEKEELLWIKSSKSATCSLGKTYQSEEEECAQVKG